MGQTSQPTISIVMATYRRPHTINRTVAQIRSQSYQDWELIVVNNARAGDYSFQDKRIKGYRHAAHASASYARNEGLRYVTGDLVCFFDDDDDMFPDYLARLAAAFEAHPQARMVRCGMVVAGGAVNFSYATPEVCLRREYASPTWAAEGVLQDQMYFRRIVRQRGWREPRDIVVVPAPLCRANSYPQGGLRAGRY
jgi:glycosyltransferase involved in cell wall biosynthesis